MCFPEEVLVIIFLKLKLQEKVVLILGFLIVAMVSKIIENNVIWVVETDLVEHVVLVVTGIHELLMVSSPRL